MRQTFGPAFTTTTVAFTPFSEREEWLFSFKLLGLLLESCWVVLIRLGELYADNFIFLDLLYSHSKSPVILDPISHLASLSSKLHLLLDF